MQENAPRRVSFKHAKKRRAPLSARSTIYKTVSSGCCASVPGGMPAHRRHIDCYEDASIPLYLYLYLYFYLFLSSHSLPLPFPRPCLLCLPTATVVPCLFWIPYKIFSKKFVVTLDITTMQCYTIDVTKIVTTIQIFWEVLHHEKGSHRMCGRQTGKVPRE